MRREELEHLVITVKIKGKQGEKMLDGHKRYWWLKKLIDAHRDVDVWKVIITNA